MGCSFHQIWGKIVSLVNANESYYVDVLQIIAFRSPNGSEAIGGIPPTWSPPITSWATIWSRSRYWPTGNGRGVGQNSGGPTTIRNNKKPAAKMIFKDIL